MGGGKGRPTRAALGVLALLLTLGTGEREAVSPDARRPAELPFGDSSLGEQPPTDTRALTAVSSCPEVRDSVARLYSAYFLRDPDVGGLEFWLERYRTGQRNLRQISEAFAASPEFTATYGQLDNAAFVDLVYHNVLGRQPEGGGRAYWTGRVNDGLSRGAMMIGFSESAEYVQLTNTTPPLAGIGRIYPVGTTFACGSGADVGNLVTQNRAMVLDVLGVNHGARSQNLLVWIDHDAATTAGPLVNEIVGADQYLLVWGIELGASTEGRAVRTVRLDFADADISWVVAAYPTGMPPDRPGWQDQTPLQLR